jgi:hypothetical protein
VTKIFKLNSEVISVDELLLKEVNKILIEEDMITDSYNYTLLNNILSLLGRYNYTFSIDAIDIFCRLEWNYRVALLGRLNQILYNESKTSHENPDKFYINYPNEVNSGDKRELYINSLLYYYFNFWKNEEEESFIDKPELTEDINLKELDFVFSLEEEPEEYLSEENEEEISEICSIQDTIKEIEMALAGGRNIEEEIEDPYADEEEDSESGEDSEEEDDDEEEIEEDILINQFLNPYEEENDDEESDEESEYEQQAYEEESKEKYDKKYNGRHIDELIEERQYLKLLKILKKEPNELARRILFVVEGVYYKYEDKNERLKNLSKTVGVFEGLVDCMSIDTLENLLETLKQRVRINAMNSKLRKLFEDLIDIIKEEFEDRKN